MKRTNLLLFAMMIFVMGNCGSQPVFVKSVVAQVDERSDQIKRHVGLAHEKPGLTGIVLTRLCPDRQPIQMFPRCAWH